MATTTDAGAAIACDINAARTGNGLPALNLNAQLSAGAQGMADDMAARHYASHVTPDGRDLPARIAPTGYIPARATWSLAENLGWGTSVLSTPLATVRGWLDSPPHRDNLLDPEMKDVGIGVALGAITPGGPTGTIYVADFGRRGTPAATVRKSRAHARRSRHTRRPRHHRPRRR